jgi:hypothetical protein
MPSFTVNYYLVGTSLKGSADVIVTQEAESIEKAREFVIQAHNDPERTFYFWSQSEVIICIPKANVLAFLIQEMPSAATDTAADAAVAPSLPYPLTSDDEPDPFALPSPDDGRSMSSSQEQAE